MLLSSTKNPILFKNIHYYETIKSFILCIGYCWFESWKFIFLDIDFKSLCLFSLFFKCRHACRNWWTSIDCIYFQHCTHLCQSIKPTNDITTFFSTLYTLIHVLTDNISIIYFCIFTGEYTPAVMERFLVMNVSQLWIVIWFKIWNFDSITVSKLSNFVSVKFCKRKLDYNFST